MDNVDYLCPVDKKPLKNAPDRTSDTLGIVMFCDDCRSFYGQNALGEMEPADDAAEAEML